MQEIHDVFDPLRRDAAALLAGFGSHQLTAIAEFLAGNTDILYRHAALLRAQALAAAGLPSGSAQAASSVAGTEGDEADEFS